MRALRPNENCKDTLLNYYNTVWAVQLPLTRLAYANLRAKGEAWHDRLMSLADDAPTAVPKPRETAPGINTRMNKTHENAVRQARLTVEQAEKRLEDFAGDPRGAKAYDLYLRYADKNDRYQTVLANYETFLDAHTQKVARWKERTAAYETSAAYETELSARRSELLRLLAEYREWEVLDSPVTTRTAFLNAYTKYVPTHHVYRSGVSGGTYIYAYRNNQIDVHFHCATYDGDVTLVTFKLWASPSGARDYSKDTYLGGQKGLTLNPSHLSGPDQTFIRLVDYLRRICPPNDTGVPERVPPPLPAHRA